MLPNAEGVGKEGKIKQEEREKKPTCLFSELAGDPKSIQSKRFSVHDQEAEKHRIVWTKQIYN